MQCARSFYTAERAMEGIEAVNMMRKGQVQRLAGDDAPGQAKFVRSLFGVAASAWGSSRPSVPQIKLCKTTKRLAPARKVRRREASLQYWERWAGSVAEITSRR